MSMALTDSTRSETLTEDAHDFRKVMVQLWYPADIAGDDNTVPYIRDELTSRLAKLHLKGLDIEGNINRTIQAYGTVDAPVSDGMPISPILLFSPGFGVSTTFYRSLIQDIVSHGYVVAAINHPHFSGITVFPNGTLVPSVEIEDPSDFSNAYFDIVLGDVKFVVDVLKGLKPGHGLYGRLDLSGFGIYGHSLGGSAAIQMAREIPGCKAALSMDGWSPMLAHVPDNPAVPLFFLLSEEEASYPPGVPPDSIYASQARYIAILDGASHIGFIDLPYMVDHPISPSRSLGTIDPNAMRATTNAILLAFFDRYLKESSEGALLPIPNPYNTTVTMDFEPRITTVEGLDLAPATKQRITLSEAVKEDSVENSPPESKSQDLPEQMAIAGLDGPPGKQPPREPYLLDTLMHIRGHVKDAHTGEGLPAATIQVTDGLEGFCGTIANEDGGYMLKLRALPAALKVTSIGYRSEERIISNATDVPLDIPLEPVPIPMGGMLVTADNPAISIMRKVLENKRKRRPMQSYRAEAYERQHWEENQDIAAIRESVVQIFWDENRGSRSVIRGMRGTTDYAEKMQAADPIWFKDFYQDSTLVQGSWLMLPTHPRALDYYDFTLEGQRYLDDRSVYDLSFEPKRKVNSGFVGTLSVLDEEYALLDIHLRPSPSAAAEFSSALMIGALDFTFRQKFRPFGRGVWLPVDYQYVCEIKADALGFHVAFGTIKGTMQLTDYQLDIPLPDSIFAKKSSVQIDPLKEDYPFARYPKEAILSERELYVYRTLGAASETETEAVKTEKAQGNSAAPRLFPQLAPEFWFNRVDAAHLGLKTERHFHGKVRLYLNGAYKTGSGRWAYGGGLRSTWGPHHNGSIHIGYQSGSQVRYPSSYYSLIYNSVPAVLGADDYFDYYWNQKTDLEIGYQPEKSRMTLHVALHNESHTSLEKSTDFDILGQNKDFRANPAIEEGYLRSLEWVGTYEDTDRRSNKRVEVGVEYSSKRLLASDFNFTRYCLAADWRIHTLFRQKATPNTLDLHLTAGTSTGTIPLQRFGVLDTGLWAFAPFGVFRSLRGRPYEGEKYLALFWEHNFRTIPFEMLGMWGLARRQMNISLYGASGKTWVSRDRLFSPDYSPRFTDGFHHEIGVSWSLVKLFRLDLTRRLDENQWRVGISIPPFLIKIEGFVRIRVNRIDNRPG